MSFKGIITAIASVGLIVTPTLAAAQSSASAAQAATEVEPASESVEGSELRGGFIIPLIALIAIILGLCIATDQCGDDEDPPTSP